MSISLKCYFSNNREDVDYELSRTIRFPLTISLEHLHQEIYKSFNLDYLVDQSSPHVFYINTDPFASAKYEFGTPAQNIRDEEQIKARLRNLYLNKLDEGITSEAFVEAFSYGINELKEKLDPVALDIKDSRKISLGSLDLTVGDNFFYICDFTEVITIELCVKEILEDQLIDFAVIISGNGVPDELYYLIRQSYKEEIELHEGKDMEDLDEDRVDNDQKPSYNDSSEELMEMFSNMFVGSILSDYPNVFNLRLSVDTPVFMKFIEALAATRVEYLLDLEREEFFDAIRDNLVFDHKWTLKLGLYITSLKFTPYNTDTNILTYTEQITNILTRKWGMAFYHSVVQGNNKNEIDRLSYITHLSLLVIALSIESIYPQYSAVNSYIPELIAQEDLKDDVLEGLEMVFTSLFDYFSVIDLQSLEVTYQIMEKRIHGGTRGAVRKQRIDLSDEIYERDWNKFSFPLDLGSDSTIAIIDKIRREIETGDLPNIIEAASLGLSKELWNTTEYEVIISILLENSPKESLESILKFINNLLNKVHELGKDCTLYDRCCLALGKLLVDYKDEFSKEDLETFYMSSINRRIRTNDRKRLVNYGFKATRSEKFLNLVLDDNAKSVRELARKYLDELLNGIE